MVVRRAQIDFWWLYYLDPVVVLVRYFIFILVVPKFLKISLKLYKCTPYMLAKVWCSYHCAESLFYVTFKHVLHHSNRAWNTDAPNNLTSLPCSTVEITKTPPSVLPPRAGAGSRSGTTRANRVISLETAAIG